jgi:ATP-dependent Clp protease adaptor protein ClpS
MKEKVSEKTEIAVLEDQELAIVLYNDDVNTFDHVIHCLVTICGLESQAAEQCAYIVHYGGKCAVKHGTFEDLEPKCTALLENGLSAEIES